MLRVPSPTAGEAAASPHPSQRAAKSAWTESRRSPPPTVTSTCPLRTNSSEARPRLPHALPSACLQLHRRGSNRRHTRLTTCPRRTKSSEARRRLPHVLPSAYLPLHRRGSNRRHTRITTSPLRAKPGEALQGRRLRMLGRMLDHSAVLASGWIRMRSHRTPPGGMRH